MVNHNHRIHPRLPGTNPSTEAKGRDNSQRGTVTISLCLAKDGASERDSGIITFAQETR